MSVTWGALQSVVRSITHEPSVFTKRRAHSLYSTAKRMGIRLSIRNAPREIAGVIHREDMVFVSLGRDGET